MVSTEKVELERATARAIQNGIRVVAHGVKNETGEPVWLVNSASHPGLLHIVGLVDVGHLGCDCPAGQHNRICQHRAVVHAELVEQYAARHETTPVAANQRDTAPLRRSNQPFQFMR